MNQIYESIVKGLEEAISSAQFPKASVLIKNYLKKNAGKRHAYLYPEPEHFISGGKHGVGIRYFFDDYSSVRFNWISDTSIDSSKNLVSMDYWAATARDSHKPTYHVSFAKGQSLVKVLPFAVDFIQNPQAGRVVYVEDEKSLVEMSIMATSFTELNEARASGANVVPITQEVVRLLGQGLQQKDICAGSDGSRKYMVLRSIKNVYPDFFEKRGTAVAFVDSVNAKKINLEKIYAAMGISGVDATVSTGTPETLVADKQTENMQENLPRLCYEEQLEDLRQAMVLLMNNATNSLYLAGRGGTGKTQTVEEELHKRGLEDGNGYFKITGSASTAGIYRTLYVHRKDILLFDDSDGALADQDSRNLFKAASDTKKVRKIAWMKGGKSYVDPEDMDEEDDNPDVLPRYFDFEGKIIFISNLALNKLDPDGALRTRGYVINIDPTDEEIYKYMGKIVNKIKLDVDHELTQEQKDLVITTLRQRKGKEGSANLRQLVRGLNTVAGILKDGGNIQTCINMVLRYA